MKVLDRLKVAAEVAELASRAYGVIVDRSKERRDKEARIKELELKVQALEKKAAGVV